MQNRTTDGTTVTTPMRKLIKKLPDLALKVCNRCFHAKEPVNHLDYNITLNYEFLDDINAEWFEDDSDHTGDDGLEDIVYKIKKALPENSTRQLQMKQNHPLILMVRNEVVYQQPPSPNIIEPNTNLALFETYVRQLLAFFIGKSIGVSRSLMVKAWGGGGGLGKKHAVMHTFTCTHLTRWMFFCT